MLIGSDSFIARSFVREKAGVFDIAGASLKPTALGHELVVDDLFKLSGSDFRGAGSVINFAAIVHRPEVTGESVYERANYQLPLHLAEAAAEGGAEHFVQMSTVAVYGGAEDISLSTPCAPESPYGRSKLKADEALLGNQSGVFTVSVVRPSMVYGGGAAPGNMMKLIRLCDLPVPLPLRRTGNSRQFAYCGLVADALEKIVSKRAGGVFLVADREPVSTEKLAEIIRAALGRPGMLFGLPAPLRRLLEKLKPSLCQKLFGSLRIDIDETFRKLDLESSPSDMEKGIAEMVEAYRLF